MAAAGTIAPDRILHEMEDLWVSLGKQGEGDAGVLRACSMTLVVAAEESDDAQAIGETLAALMPEHPSRAIVIRFRAGDGRELSSRVFAQCWMPFGHRRQICCEQIEITASDASLPDLVAVLVALKVPDLPVILWCRSPRLFALNDFSQLAGIAQKEVLDSAAFDPQTSAFPRLSAAVAAGRSLADLSWTRLTRWRELVAQIFENRSQLAHLPEVSDITIRYRAAATPATAYYLAAWLSDGFEKIGAHPRLHFAADAGDASGRLSLVEMRAEGAADPIASIALGDGPAAEVRVGELASKALLPALNDYALMREELSIPGRDPVFEGALAGAANLALS
ncbi:MAG: glucose-6-phosphate dehydrogenase assembly protein OpcA [Bryobacteraceae bacterium]|jgi:glucose-6-phosphate dehydrogenase assembly protein OpcA